MVDAGRIMLDDVICVVMDVCVLICNVMWSMMIDIGVSCLMCDARCARMCDVRYVMSDVRSVLCEV